MLNPIGYVGNLLRPLGGFLPKAGNPLGIKGAMGVDALIEGSNILKQKIHQYAPGSFFDTANDPIVIPLGSNPLTGKLPPELLQPRQHGPTLNELNRGRNIPGVGQTATLGGKEVKWDGSRWVRTNIEELAADPLGAQQSQPPAQIFGIPVEDFEEPAPVGQGSQGSTGADDPSYLTNAFKKALIARLLLSSNQDTSSLGGFGDDPYSSVLASQRELGRTLIN